MVTIAYSNDLEDSMEKLTDKMQTVEGMRAKGVQEEFGSASSNLASASVQSAKREGQRQSSKTPKGRRPNDKCYLNGHVGHLNKDCSWQKLRKLKDVGRACKPVYDSSGRKICEFLANDIFCPFGKKCNQSHHTRASNSRRANTATTDSSDDERDSRRRHKKSKKRSKRSKRKHKSKRRVHVARTTSEDTLSSSCSSSSDFP